VECGEVNAIAVLQKVMHSVRTDLTMEGHCLKHSPTIERDRLGGERGSQAPDEQGSFHSTLELYRDSEAGRDEGQIEDDERGDEDEESEDVKLEALCQS
jgi:hypothetical protein